MPGGGALWMPAPLVLHGLQPSSSLCCEVFLFLLEPYVGGQRGLAQGFHCHRGLICSMNGHAEES